jgi:hypothetical protein
LTLPQDFKKKNVKVLAIVFKSPDLIDTVPYSRSITNKIHQLL